MVSKARNSKVLVSVVIPVYNAEKYLANAIKSVLNQSYVHFELILLNDGSTDSSLRIMNSFSDKRIRIISLPVNGGLVAARNRGIHETKGKYLAHLDADDEMLPNRLREQVSFMEEHSDVGVVGSYITFFHSTDIQKYPLSNFKLKWFMQVFSPFCNPAVLLRTSVIQSKTFRDLSCVEDLDMWFQLSSVTKFATIPFVLTRYRRHESSISQSNSAKMQRLALNYRAKNGVWFLRPFFLLLKFVPAGFFKSVVRLFRKTY